MSNMNKQIHWFSLTLSSLFLTLTMVVAGLLLTSNQVAAQNYIINPATDGGFEGSHGWTILNTNNVNKWIVGASEKSAGTKGAYISDNNNTNTLTNPQVGNSRIYLYKDVVIPLNATSISISFKYKNNGTDSVSAPRCLFEQTSDFPTLPTDGRSYIVGAEFLTVLNKSTGWTTYTNLTPLGSDRSVTYTSGPLEPGTSYRIVFEWIANNQTSFTQQPPICTYPATCSITGNLSSIAPGSTEVYNAVTTGGGANFTYQWAVTNSTITAGQGTSSVSVYFPPGFTGGTIQYKLICATPVYASNGKNSGPLAIDEVAMTYTATPKITSFTPLSAAVGGSVTITGEFFGATAADNIVYLGGVKCPITAASSTSITVTIPPFAALNNFTVLNTSANLSCTSPAKLVTVNTSLAGIGYSGYASGQNGSFENVVSFTTGATSLPTSSDQKYKLADIDGDGKLDIVTYISNTLVPQIFRNTATAGTIAAGSLTLNAIASVSPTYTGNTIANVLVADLNNDGKLDIAATNGTTNNGGFANINTSVSGTPSFQNFSSITSSSSEYKVAAAFVPMDVNLDGRMDIVGLNGVLNPSQVYFTKNTSTGNTFTVQTGNTANTGSYNQKLNDFNFISGAEGDLDGDGKVDLALGGNNQLYVLKNSTIQGAAFNKSFKFEEVLFKATESGANTAVKLADLDLDGKLDIVITNGGSTNVSVFRNITTAGGSIDVANIQNFPSALSTRTSGLALADMNGDAKPDIIVSNNSAGIAYLENTSVSGTISFATAVVVVPTGIYYHLEVADMDGDNKPDIIASSLSSGQSINIFRNRQGEAGVIAGNQTVCSGTIPAALTSTSPAAFPTGTISYLWENATTVNGSWSTAAGTANSEAYTPTATVATTTYFRRRAVSSSAPTVFYYASPVMVTVTPLPTITGSTAATGCGTTTVSLAATTGVGNTIQWFTAATLGSPIGTDPTLVTPSISATTNYFAGAITANGCVSASRTTVAATIISIVPVISGSTPASRCDAGSVTLSAALSAGTSFGATISWYAAPTGGVALATGTSFVTPVITATTTFYAEANNCNGASVRTAVVATVNNTPNIASVQPAAGCQGTNVVLSATATAGNLNWYTAATGGAASGGNATVSAISANTTRFVSAISAVGSCESPRTSVVATLNTLPAAPTAVPATLCGLGTATVGATPAEGCSISWWNLSAAGVKLGDAGTYTTPVISSTQTYYALTTNANGCNSASRTAVAATYNGPVVGSVVPVRAITNAANQKFVSTGLANQTSFIWQRSTDSMATWVDITANLDPNITYSGFSGTTETTATLTISEAKSYLHGYFYRLKSVKTVGCENFSNGAMLYVADVFGTCNRSYWSGWLAATPLTAYSTPISSYWWHTEAGYDPNAMDPYGNMGMSTYNSVSTYDNSPASLIDGSFTSGWVLDEGSPISGGYYITLDLGTAKIIDQVYMNGFNDYSNSGWGNSPEVTANWDGGKIQVSNDLITWTDVYTNITGTGGYYSNPPLFRFPTVSARYVRAYRSSAVANANSGGTGLSEFKVYEADLSITPYIRFTPAASTLVASGGMFTATMSATAGVGAISYQWSGKLNGAASFTNLTNGLAAGITTTGASTNTVSVSPFAVSKNGFYKLTASQPNGCSVTATLQATLVGPYYSSAAGAGALQTLGSWNTGATGTGGTAPPDFGNGKLFVLANSTNSTYTLGNNWQVDGSLLLNTNKLTLGNFNATIDSLMDASSVAFVKTNGSGKLLSVVSSIDKVFPVGNSTYNPVTITNNTGADDTYSVAVVDTVLSTGTTGGSPVPNVVKRTWTINKSTANTAGTGTALTFKWKPTDTTGLVTNPVLYAYVAGTGWVAQTAGTITRTDSTVTYTRYMGALTNTQFMLANPVPVITSFTPTSAGSGVTITINGTGLSNASAVTLGGVTAVVVSNTATQITAVVGAGASGSVSVTTPGGTATLAGFTYLLAPTIAYFTPTKANAGTTVTITGANFNNATAVTFGGTSAVSFTVVSSTQITAIVRTGTTGSVSVTTPGGIATKAGFVYGLPYTSVDVLAAWNATNTSTQTYPYAATTTRPVVVGSASQNYSGLTTENSADNKWNNPNTSASLVTASAPYASYTITTTVGTKFDRFVLPGLNMTSATTPATKIQLRWSVDNFAASLGEFTPGTGANFALSSVDLTSTTTQVAGAIEFRTYFYNGSTDIIAQAAGNSYVSTDGTAPSFDGNYGAMIFGDTKPAPTFGLLADITKNLGSPAFYITPPASNSTGAITYTITDAAVASVVGSRVSINGTGVTTLTATQAATADYAQASVTAQVTVKTAPTIFFPDIYKVYGSPSFGLTANSNSAGAFTYTSGTPATATVAASTVSLVSASGGSTVLTANQAANGVYNADSSKAILTVGTAANTNPTISWITGINKLMSNATFFVNGPPAPTSNSAGGFTYFSSNFSVATISGTTVTLVNPGVSVITALQAANGIYNTASVSTILTVGTVGKTDPTITGFAPITKSVSDAAFSLVAPTSNSAGAFQYISSNPAVAVVNGNTVTLTGIGTATLIAIQQADGIYNAGSISTTLTVLQTLPAFSYTGPNNYLKSAVISPTLAPSSTGGAVVSYSISPSLLPRGVAFNTTTGVFSGTPTANKSATTYVVTGTNTGGSSTANVTIAVIDAAPSGLSYTTPNVYNVGTSITTLVPVVSGGPVVKYSVSPALPSGLGIDSTTGEISGTPSLATAQATYVVTAANSGGSVTANVVIRVNDALPTLLSYSTPNVFFKRNTILPLTASASGGAIVSFSVSPALPAGLSLNTTTGDITGMPTSVTADATYVVSGTNSAGTITASLNILVNDAAPDSLSYTSPSSFPINSSITPLLPTSIGGVVASYTVAPALPAGLSIHPTTGAISGTPTTITPAATYSVTAKNFIGYTSADVVITITDAPPSGLSYTSPNSYLRGTAITSLTPTVSGGVVVSYSVVPALSAGLVLNTVSGVISGTPTIAAVQTTYVVTATNTGGSTSANVVITVNDTPPSALSYTTPNVFTNGTAISNLSPTVSGGLVITYTVNPLLPTGLAINATSGVISGTPSAVTAQGTYVVTATNSGGSTTANVVITVNDVVPSALSYTTPNVYTNGTAISNLSPTVSGGTVTSYTVNPSLPAGLAINATSGVISGTPSAVVAQGTYVVTATNSGGSTTANVVITVNDVVPSALSYTTPNVFTNGTAISNLSPTVSGGTVTSYTVNPSLPAGLAINATSGVISGTPSAVVAQATYVVTATNSGGSTTANVVITVNDVIPSALSYTTPNVFTKGTAISSLSPTVSGGVVTSYTVNPSLPTGLTINSTSGVISGTPSAITVQGTYVVTATNSGGFTTTNVVITVNDVIPSALSYTTPNVFTMGTAITNLSPTVSGGTVITYTVSPSLPAGLAINATSGVISGTPSAITAQGTYVVTATNTGGSTTANVVITVNDVIPSALSYTTPNVYTNGTAISNLSPTVSGGTVTSYTVNPSLPAGLAINATSGVISGTPSAVTAQRTYVVTATNTGGFTTANVVITVNDVVPSALSYTTPNVFTNGTAISNLSPTVSGGTVTSYTVNPSLPAGLAINATSGVISGTPSAVTAQGTYVVTATNSGGFTTANVVITVNAVAPSALVYTPSPVIALKDITNISSIPSASGGAVVSYSILPALPAGVSINATTGEISGTPSVVSSINTYTITATNSGGSTQGSFTLTVIQCTIPTNGGAIGNAQAACNTLDPTVILSSTLPSGQVGTLEYQWQQSTVGSTSGFTAIANSNSPNYDPSILTATTWYKRIARVGCMPDWNNAAESNVVAMTVNQLPAAPAGANSTVCLNIATSIGAAGTAGSTYSWTSVPAGFTTTNPNPTVTPLVSTTYTVTETVTASGCTKSNSVTVTVNALPTVAAITGTGTVCVGSTTNLSNATAGGVWSSATPAVATISPTGVVTGVATGNSVISYTVTNSITGCVTVVTTSVTVNALPVVGPITGTVTACAGATTSLSNATAGGVWSSATPSVASINSSGVVTGVAAGNAVISYTVTNSSGCITVATTTITIKALPTVAPITGLSTVLVNGTITLANATAGGVWSSSLGSVATISSAGLVSGLALGSTTISYTVTSNGCSNAATSVISVVDLPVPTITFTGSNTFCEGGSLLLTSSASSRNQWYKGGIAIATGGTSQTYLATTAGTYTVLISDALGRTSQPSTSVIITVNPLPTVAAITGINTVCLGATTNLFSTTPGGVWSSATAAVATISANGVVTGVAAGTSAINYTVTNANGCVNKSTATLTVNALPVVAAISGSSSLCAGASITLGNATAGGVWNSATLGVATISATGVVSGISAGTSVVKYTVTNAAGCVTVVSTTITVNALPAAPVLSAGAITTFCQGGAVLLTSSAEANYQWYNGAVLVSGASAGNFSANSSGNYTVVVSNSNGCVSTASNAIAVTVNPLPATPTITAVGATIFCKDESVMLRTTVQSGISYQWFNNGSAIASATSDSLRVFDEAYFTLQITNANGCKSAFSAAMATKMPCVIGIVMPKIFTPNGDGINEKIQPSVPGMKKFGLYKVYNRWGNLVFETREKNSGWDGRTGGKVQPAGSYVWIVEGEDGRGNPMTAKGTFTLIR